MNSFLTVAEVACALFPDTGRRNALRRFRYMLKTDPSLWNELTEARFHAHQRVFTPQQYAILVRYIGEP